MIATGTDVKPLECVFFMRDVRSAQYFEQMKGRGARTIAPADFQAVTPDAKDKTPVRHRGRRRCHRARLRRPPLNRDKGISLKKLLDKAATLTLTEDETATLASRLAKLELELTPAERSELDDVAGQPVRDIVRALVDAVDPDTQAKAIAGAPPTRMLLVASCWSGPSSRWPPIPDCATASSNSVPPTTGSSTRSTPTSCSTPTASSTPAGPGRSSSPGRST
jgi:superfamily II DNA or RNA helicase